MADSWNNLSTRVDGVDANAAADVNSLMADLRLIKGGTAGTAPTTDVETLESGKVAKALYDAGTLLYAASDNTPVATTLAEFNTLMLAAGFGVPVGCVQDYISDTAPTGWILATAATPKTIGKATGDYQGTAYKALYDLLWATAGTDDTYAHKISSAKGASATADWDAGKTIGIDYRGGVLRATGVGAGWTDTDAGSTTALGRKQDDQKQASYMTITDDAGQYIDRNDGYSGGSAGLAGQGGARTHEFQAKGYTTDGTHGTPRTGYETRMKNIGVHKIIKY